MRVEAQIGAADDMDLGLYVVAIAGVHSTYLQVPKAMTSLSEDIEP